VVLIHSSKDVRRVAQRYLSHEGMVEIEPYGCGHINETFKVRSEHQHGVRHLLLQRVNHEVFRQPERVMHNICSVTKHISRKLDSGGASENDRCALKLLETNEGEPWFRSPNGSWWRAFDFIDKSVMITDVTPESVAAAGAAYGQFQGWLADYDGPELEETIPRFHDTVRRLEQLETAIAEDRCERAAQARSEIERLRELSFLADNILELEESGLPRRIVHNDAKLDNVLFDAVSSQALCVVDLDTVMPGTVLHDFGDMIRSMTSPTAEDEESLDLIGVRDDLFSALIRGYLSTASSFLTKTERENLVCAGQVLTYEVATRFLADYLVGDTYFKVHRPKHNLIRARSQIKLLETLIAAEEWMQATVEEVSSCLL
jgi:hypothetical protein